MIDEGGGRRVRVVAGNSAASGVVIGDSRGAETASTTLTGSAIWTHHTGGPVTTSASLCHGTAYIGSGDGAVSALAETTGRLVWFASTMAAVTAGGVHYR